jgi:hypothetical protein
MLISLRAALLAAVALLAPFVVGQELPPQLTQQVADLFAGNGSVSSGATVAGIGATGGRHTNNWAVLVCASRYWFNYRVCRGGSCSIAHYPASSHSHRARPRCRRDLPPASALAARIYRRPH